MDDWRAQSVGLRRFYWVAVGLVTSVDVFTFVLSGDTARLIAWPIKASLTAAFLGANYWAAFFLAFLTARERIWSAPASRTRSRSCSRRSRCSATLIHLEKFSFDNANG